MDEAKLDKIVDCVENIEWASCTIAVGVVVGLVGWGVVVLIGR